ncbi:MAG: hypothetical protein J1F23_00550 [Oscillospiraceae bacterium]|nr:hypothetical protein [Oscillospiraceae bacterium]
MKKYVLSTATGKLHRTDSSNGNCHSMKIEHRKEFDSVQEAKEGSDSRIHFCKNCMKEEKEEFGQWFI